MFSFYKNTNIIVNDVVWYSVKLWTWLYFRTRIKLERTDYGYILQLLKMEKKRIVVLIGSLQAASASYISAFTAVWKIMGKLKKKWNMFTTFRFQA